MRATEVSHSSSGVDDYLLDREPVWNVTADAFVSLKLKYIYISSKWSQPFIVLPLPAIVYGTSRHILLSEAPWRLNE